MDSMTDKAPFAKLLDQICSAWNKPPATDVMQETYWRALRDVRLPEVRANVDRILRTAGKRDPFPKPSELRNEPPNDAKPDDKFREGEQRSTDNLVQLRRADEGAWRNDVWLRRLDRVLATESPDSPIYAQALEESRRLRPLVRGY